MNIEDFRLFCLTFPEVEETFPFGPDVLVYKVCNKVFALTNLNNSEFKVNLKAKPEDGIEYRMHYPESILPGFHMNKKHWNTVYFESELTNDFLIQLITDSFNLVVENLRKTDKNRIMKLGRL